mmetsp:Transcript_53413/g.99456  ORF Transcript_53413/g.99456 Transcript_53413/m.99456 type:complete len:419 (+) Transcript_53413:99-1355(+)
MRSTFFRYLVFYRMASASIRVPSAFVRPWVPSTCCRGDASYSRTVAVPPLQVDKGFSLLEVAGKVVPQGRIVAAVRFVWRFVWGRMMAELAPQDKTGAYARPSYAFGGVLGSEAFPAESGRYHLYLGNPCPWCHRVALVVALRGLGTHVSCTRLLDDPTKARRGGWIFSEAAAAAAAGSQSSSPLFVDSLGPDPVFGESDLFGVYEAAQPGFKGRCTAPLLVDKVTKQIVSNESADIVRMLGQLTTFQAPSGDEIKVEAEVLRPQDLSSQVDKANAWTQELLNNGVYRCGFSTSQAAYDVAALDVLEGLRKLEELLLLGGGPYVLGDRLTEVDVRLLPTLLRFDAAYAPLFRAGGGQARVRDFPAVDAWMRHVWSLPGVKSTVDLEDAWGSYFRQLFPLNPGRLQPKMPDPARDLGLV